MAKQRTAKQIAASRRNIKLAQAARLTAPYRTHHKAIKPRSFKLPKPKHKGRVRTPIHRVSTPLDRIATPID